MHVNAGSTATIGANVRIEVNGDLEVSAKKTSKCVIAGSVDATYVTRSGNCASKLP